MADVTVLYVTSQGQLAQIQDGDNLLADNLTRKSSSGNLTIGGNVTGAGEDIVIGSALSSTGEILLGSVDSLAHVLGDAQVDGLVSTPILEVTTAGEVRFYETDNTNYVALKAAGTIASDVTWILPNVDSTGTQYLYSDGGGNLGWGDPGDVTGPASSTDRAIALFNGTTGKVIQNSGVIINVDNDLVFPGAVEEIRWGVVRALTYSGTTLFVGQDTGADLVVTVDIEASTNTTFSINGTDVMEVTSTGLDLNNHHLDDLATANYNSWPTGDSGSSISILFDDYQARTVTLNAANVTITLNTPRGPGAFKLILIQDGTGGRNVTWATEGTELIYAPGGTLAPDTNANTRTLYGLIYDGTNWTCVKSGSMQTV